MISLSNGYTGCSLLLLSLPQVSGISIDHMSCFSDSAGRFQESSDLIPVCTQETGAKAAYASKFEERGVKLLGLSCDDVQTHKEWIEDIEAYNDTEEAICLQMDRVLFCEKEYCCWGNSSEATMRSTLDVFFAKTKAIAEPRNCCHETGRNTMWSRRLVLLFMYVKLLTWFYQQLLPIMRIMYQREEPKKECIGEKKKDKFCILLFVSDIEMYNTYLIHDGVMMLMFFMAAHALAIKECEIKKKEDELLLL